MKKEKISLILAGLMTLNILGGCSFNKDKETQESDDVISLVQNDEVDSTVKIFDEGKHIIQYLVDCEYDYYEGDYEGYVPTLEIPEGYSYVTAFSTIKKTVSGSKSGKIVFIFINEVPVEVQGLKDEKTGEVTYPNPGIPVSNTLKLVPEK